MMPVKIYQPGNRILSAMESVTLANWVSESLDNGFRYLAVDLCHVTFMDSRGLGALMLIQNRVERAGGVLALCAVRGQAGMLLDLTSVKDKFSFYASVADFKAAIAPSVEPSSIPAQ